ncbi:Metallo-dependent phosphatase-like protein [Mycena metata]|uniref:Sphingomyelin phosphodiesterase n=1 Tax=Mycena metata TaxID=1033252 RepID=A0AAD7HBZ9_9AGAR|nr:Metallo-dependent phosphatase-like protein [Mycena metata]
MYLRVLFPLPILLSFASALKPDGLISAFKNAVDCDSCHALLVPLKGLAELGDSAFVKTMVEVCKVLKLEDDDVCVGGITEQGPILAHALRGISPLGTTATKLCEGTFGLCQPPAVNPYTVPLPAPGPPAARKQSVSAGKTPFQVVHFSDVHIDREYVAGSDANCKKPICCRDFADEAKPPIEPAGAFGNPNCDSPVGLAKSMLEQISAHHTWSIFTGDVVEAAVWLVNKSEVTHDIRRFNHELVAALNAPVFPAIGNHDSAPVNNFPLDATVGYFDAQWVFDLEGKQWAHWTNRTAKREVKHFSGSYSITAPGTNLRIISLNTVYWYKQNFWLYESDTPEADPREILAFMVSELQAAEDAGQRVWIIGHMPPGCEDALSDQSNYYDQIVQRYHSIIAGQFFGHTHYDEFEIAYSNYEARGADTAVNVAWIAPALTPRSGNPAFRVYDVDPETYEIMDSKVYSADLKNPEYQTKPEWKLYYSARAEYGPLVDLAPTAPLDARFWHDVTEAFERNETAFQRYNTFLTRGGHVAPCDAACKKAAICQMRAARAQDNCHVAKPGTTFGDTERDQVVMTGTGSSTTTTPAPASGPSARQHAQCEGAGIGYLLSQFSRKVAIAGPVRFE